MTLLQQQYESKQQQFHPDQIVSESAQLKRINAQLSAYINDAYRTLRVPIKRATYLLSLKGVRLNTETDTKFPPDFLMAQIEFREQLLEAAGNATVIEAFILQMQEKQHQLSDAFKIAYESNNDAEAYNLVRQWQFFLRLEEEARGV